MDTLTLTAPLAAERRPTVPIALDEPEDPAAFESRLAALGVRTERRVVAAEVDVPAIRKELGLSQEEFALRFGLDVGTLRGWEQGRFRPDTAARVLLRVIAREPAAVERALAD
jgi:putative transcriptional regulator